MYFLKKLMSIGGNAAAKKFQDQEKPFLDHLEDLRGTMIKVFGTLIVSTIIAFIWRLICRLTACTVIHLGGCTVSSSY